MANMDRSKKLLVRTALVTGSTVATLIGAQSLALLDQRSFAVEAQTAAVPTVEAVQLQQATATTEIIHEAPSIVILRGSTAQQATAVPAAATNNTTTVILPPSPQVAASSPVVVQQQAPVTSRSSR